VHPNNSIYGHASILCRYAGVPVQRLGFVIPEGIRYNEATIPKTERGLTVLSYPAYLDRAFAASGCKVVPSASPFIYALTLAGARPERPSTGTLFMLAHCTKRTHLVTDEAALADELAGLLEPYAPVTVCLHPNDAAKAPMFTSRGLACVTNGGRDDPEFLFRLIGLFDAHRYVAVNEVGTSTVYAFASRRPVRIRGRIPEVVRIRGGRRVAISHLSARKRGHAIRAACSDGEDVTEQQQRIADYYLRRSALIGAEEMARLIAACRRNVKGAPA